MGKRWLLGVGLVALVAVVGTLGYARSRPVEYDAKGRPRNLVQRWLAPSPRINVVIIAIDTLRADSLGVYGGHPQTSPELDAFAGTATVFEHMTAPAPITLISFTSMFTGLYAPAHGVVNNKRKADQRLVTLAEVLRSAGYRTAAFTGGGYMRSSYDLDQGFQEFRYKIDGSRLITNAIGAAESWVRDQGDSPYFLFVHGFDPHRPYRPEPLPAPPAGYEPPSLDLADGIVEHVEGGGAVGDFSPGELRLAYQTVDLERRHGYDELFKTHARQQTLVWEVYNRGWAESPDFEAELAWMRSLYDAEVRMADAAVGGFLRFLQERDAWEDTLVIFTSDHGDQFMATLMTGHRRAGQGVAHVPLIVRPPPSLAPEPAPRVSTVVSGVDILPTVLDYAGYPSPAPVQGRSLRPAIEGRALPEVPVATFGGSPLKESALRFGAYKAILRPARSGDPLGDRLFDLSSDPTEQRDLREAEPSRFAELSAHLDALRQESERIGALYGAEMELRESDLEALRELGYVVGPEALD